MCPLCDSEIWENFENFSFVSIQWTIIKGREKSDYAIFLCILGIDISAKAVKTSMHSARLNCKYSCHSFIFRVSSFSVGRNKSFESNAFNVPKINS